jgi:hypothetical protein
MRTCKRERRGVALVLVLLFVVLVLSLWGVAFRRTAALLRLDTVRVEKVVVDQPNVIALAQAVTLLETGTPETQPTWDSQHSLYTCCAIVSTPSGPQSFLITYQKGGGGIWTVQAQPGTSAVNIPATFGS